MRSSKKTACQLLIQAKQALGVKDYFDVFDHIRKFECAILDALNVCQVTISPYHNDRWGVTWPGSETEDCFVPIDPDTLTLPVDQFVYNFMRIKNASHFS